MHFHRYLFYCKNADGCMFMHIAEAADIKLTKYQLKAKKEEIRPERLQKKNPAITIILESKQLIVHGHLNSKNHR